MSHPPPHPTSPQPAGGLLHGLGLVPRPDVPSKATRMMQLTWSAAAAGAAYALFSILAAMSLPFYLPTGGFIGSALFALVASAGLCIIAKAILSGRLSRMIAADRRLVPSLALGVAGLITVVNLALVWGPGWYVLLAILLLLAEIGGIIAAFVLLLQPDVLAWLNAQPGPTAPGYGGAPPHPNPPPHGDPPPSPQSGPPPPSP